MQTLRLKKHTLLMGIAGVVILCAAACAFIIVHFETSVDETHRSVVIEVPRGASFYSVYEKLNEAGLVKNKKLFFLLAYLKEAETHVGSGEYMLDSSMSPREILEKLARGEVIQYRVSFPEGFTVKQIAQRLAEKNLVAEDAFLDAASDKSFIASLGVEGETAEGYLFPDTYSFHRSMGERGIIRAMAGEFNKKVTPAMKERAGKLGFTLKKVITLASIVEKEGGGSEEKPLIAAVFLNRLKRRMRLQSDPTVIYGIKDFDGNLKKTHLQTETPYNTYLINGLPPGPICNPGFDSIMAVLYPADVNYLYFVSKNDGTHHFSSNLKSHNEAVLTYQINRRRRR